MKGAMPEDEVTAELRRISRLLLLIATKGQSQQEQVESLSRVGLKCTEIAALIGCTRGTVTKALSRMRWKPTS